VIVTPVRVKVPSPPQINPLFQLAGPLSPLANPISPLSIPPASPPPSPKHKRRRKQPQPPAEDPGDTAEEIPSVATPISSAKTKREEVRINGEPEDQSEDEKGRGEADGRLGGGPEDYCQPNHAPLPSLGRRIISTSRILKLSVPMFLRFFGLIFQWLEIGI
jgi:hypothetical protein